MTSKSWPSDAGPITSEELSISTLQSRDQSNLKFGSVNQASAGYEVKGFSINRRAFYLLEKTSVLLADTVHKAMVVAAQNWIERHNSFDFGEISLKWLEVNYHLSFNKKLAVISPNGKSHGYTVELLDDVKSPHRQFIAVFHDENIDNMVLFMAEFFCPKL